MSKNVKVTSQRVLRIALSVIKSGGYQRPTNPRQVDKIVSGFSEAKLGMPVVSHRDGQFYIIDGNHRVSALRKLNFTHAHFIVLEGLTYEDEAEFFRTQGDGSRNLTKFNLYGAALEAKDPLTVNMTNDEYASLLNAAEQDQAAMLKNPNFYEEDHRRIMLLMSDADAKVLINDEFGFEVSRIKILHEAEVNVTPDGSRYLKFEQMPRRPAYASTDWNYIRFNVRGYAAEWYYEMCNGQLYEVCV